MKLNYVKTCNNETKTILILTSQFKNCDEICIPNMFKKFLLNICDSYLCEQIFFLFNPLIPGGNKKVTHT